MQCLAVKWVAAGSEKYQMPLWFAFWLANSTYLKSHHSNVFGTEDDENTPVPAKWWEAIR
jgi:hypothetical protein